MENNEARPEIREISYGSLVFRQIDRIMSLSTKDFVNDQSKLFTFKWSVKLLRSSIPNEIIDKDFLKKEQNINWTRIDPKDYVGQFDEVQKLFSLCIDHLAIKGYLYKKAADGEYEDE